MRKDEEDRTHKAMEAFLDDIEEDKEYRQNFQLYKNQEYHPSTESENEDDDLHIGVEEVGRGSDSLVVASCSLSAPCRCWKTSATLTWWTWRRMRPTRLKLPAFE